MQRALFAVLAVLGTTGPALAQSESQIFNAFAIATAKGVVVRSGEKQAMLAGTVMGPMFVETDEGPVEAGSVSCAASLKIDDNTKRQSCSGACTFTAPDGATAWGQWECEGYELVGCRGKLSITGGTARLQGVSGEGAMIWRPRTHELNKTFDGTTEITTSGIILWREFTLNAKN